VAWWSICVPNLKFPRYGGGPNIWKVRHVIPSPTVNRVSPVTPYVSSLYNFHGATMTIEGSLQVRIPTDKAFFNWFFFQNVTGSRDLKKGGRIWNSRPRLPIHYTTFMGLRWQIRVVYKRASPLLRPFWVEKLAKKLRFEKMLSKYKISFSGPPKGTSLRKATSFDVLIVNIGAGGLALEKWKIQKSSQLSHFCGGGGEFKHFFITNTTNDMDCKHYINNLLYAFLFLFFMQKPKQTVIDKITNQ